MEKIVKEVTKEAFSTEANTYLEQLKSEYDIAIFPQDAGKFYYMNKGLVHEIRFDDGYMIDTEFKSWSVEEKNFVMNVLDNRPIW